MNIKDGGALMSVDNATNMGEKLSQMIMELLFEILKCIKNRNSDDGARLEYLYELKEVENRLRVLYEAQIDLSNVYEDASRVLTPAEKMFGSKKINSTSKARSKPLSSEMSFDF